MRSTRSIRAVALDVDGTLYRQSLLRTFMALELATLPLAKCSYTSAAHVWKIARTFRRVREELRELGAPSESLEQLQYTRTAERIHDEDPAIQPIVQEWIFKRPLKYLKFCQRPGVNACLKWLEERKIPIGVFSDYPVREKLQALGISARIEPALCATDQEINAFKPHPKGFLRLCEIWRLSPEEVLYVGDRPEVDAVGALAAGMPCIIVKSNKFVQLRHKSCHFRIISSFQELQHVLVNSIKR